MADCGLFKHKHKLLLTRCFEESKNGQVRISVLKNFFPSLQNGTAQSSGTMRDDRNTTSTKCTTLSRSNGAPPMGPIPWIATASLDVGKSTSSMDKMLSTEQTSD